MNKTRIMSLVLAMVMVLGMLTVPAFAADKKYEDGTYTGTATVVDSTGVNFDNYQIKVDVTVEDGVIKTVAYNADNDFGGGEAAEDNEIYVTRAMNGRSSRPGMASQIVAANGTEGVDAVSTATCTSNAIVSAVNSALDGHEVKEQEEAKAAYVLMNIPYADFYAAEGTASVDAVTSATLNKTRNSLSAGSYHVNSDGSDITGVIYPVKVDDLSKLTGKQVTDEDSVEITVTNRGTTTTTTYEGKDALFENPSYSYYVLSEEPAYYKELTVNEDGTLSFGAATGTKTEKTVTGTLLAGTDTNYGDYQINISGLTGEGETIDTIFGVVIHTAEGGNYAMRHLENIWRQTQIAWSIGHTTQSHGSPLSYANYTGTEGQTVTGMTYYTSSGIIELTLSESVALPRFIEITAAEGENNTVTVTGIPEDAANPKADVYYTVGSGRDAQIVYAAQGAAIENGTVALENPLEAGQTYTVAVSSDNYAPASATFTTASESGYVLMNIPYAEFYAGEGVNGVDAVTSATVKTFNQTMAGGSYHEGYDAPDPISDAEILGVTYPVYVEDMSVLANYTEVKADDTATITVASGKSSTTTKEVQGADLLFASGTYAYMVLEEAPNRYKTLTVDGESLSFSAVNEAAEAATGLEAEVTYGGHYTDVVLSVADATRITDTAVVNGIIVTTAEGEKYALRHVEEIWRKTELGWNWDSLDGKGIAGKTITNVTYYVLDNGTYGVYSYDVNAAVKLQPTAVTAKFADENTVTLTGLPEDIENPKATVQTQVGRGQTPTVIADAVEVVDGRITTTDPAVNGQTYTVKITSDNYADKSTTAKKADNTVEAADVTVEPAGYHETVTVEIPVTITDNKGVSAMTIEFSGIDLKGAEVTANFGNVVYNNLRDFLKVECWEETAPQTDDLMFTITFDYENGAMKSGTYPITVTVTDPRDGEIQDVEILAVDGSVTIKNYYLPGDVNMDGEVNNADLILVARYVVELVEFTDFQKEIGDMNKDGEVSNIDVIMIARVIVGLPIEEA